MDLAQFVEETLSEVLGGIRAAQRNDGGGAVGAEMYGSPKDGLLVMGGVSGTFTIVEFDVSDVAETSAGGKGELRVWTAGSDQQTSRVRFAVQLQIPRGAAAPRSSSSSGGRAESEYDPFARI